MSEGFPDEADGERSRPPMDGTWPFGGMHHEDVVLTPRGYDGPPRSLLNKRLIIAGRNNPRLAHMFTEENLHPRLRGLVEEDVSED